MRDYKKTKDIYINITNGNNHFTFKFWFYIYQKVLKWIEKNHG